MANKLRALIERKIKVMDASADSEVAGPRLSSYLSGASVPSVEDAARLAIWSGLSVSAVCSVFEERVKNRFEMVRRMAPMLTRK